MALIIRTCSVTELVGKLCSQGELEEAFLNNELTAYVLLPILKAFNERREFLFLEPGTYRIGAELAKSLIAQRGREDRMALIECFDGPIHNTQRFKLQYPGLILRYEDLRVAHDDLLMWCEAKDKRSKDLPSIPNDGQFTECDLLTVIYRLMVLLADQQKEIKSPRRHYRRGEQLSANALADDLEEVMTAIGEKVVGCGNRKMRAILSAAKNSICLAD